MKVVIIGGAGFIGKALWTRLSLAGHDVLAIDVVDRGLVGKSGHYEKRDILGDSLHFGESPDVVFYLAQSQRRDRFPDEADHLFGVNTQGAIRAANEAARCGARFFCYASSGNVYKPSFMPLAEDNELRRDEPYALSKVMAEEALMLFRGDMQVLSVRLFGIFGRGQRAMLPWRLYNLVQAGGSIILQPSRADPEDRDGLRISFCHVEDAVGCLTRLAECALRGVSMPSALNVAGPEDVSVRRFSETLGRVVGRKPQFTIASEPRDFDLVADIGLLRSLVNPIFTPFSEAMSKSFSSPVP